jgi:hypothetical protein
MAYIYDLTDTWNAGGTTFYGIKMNVTNTASAAGSKLLSLQVGGSEKFGVDKDGNVGVGTASPGARLETSVTSAGATAEVLRLSNPGSGANTQAQLNFYTTSTSYATITGGYGASAPQMTFNLPSVTAGNYVWQISSSEKMRLDTSGNLGIGTATPAAKLQVVGNMQVVGTSGVASTTLISAISGLSNGYEIVQSAANALTYNWRKGDNTVAMTLDSAGNVGIGTTSPDYKLTAATNGASTFNYVASVNTTAVGAYGAGFLARAGSGFSYFYMRGDGIAYLENATANPLGFATNSTERVRIDASGNVGIGTPSPTGGGGGTTLNVFGGSAASFRLSSSTDAFDLFLAGGSGFVQTATAIPMVFRTNATERMRIDSSGNVGIGTTAPAYKLDVSATGNISGRVKTSGALNAFYMEDAGTTAGALYIGSVGNDWRVVTGSNERMRIDASGNVQVGTGAIATTATDGFLYIPTCAGTPTGTPTAKTGFAPMVVDSTNNKLYVYVGGAWQAMN